MQALLPKTRSESQPIGCKYETLPSVALGEIVNINEDANHAGNNANVNNNNLNTCGWCFPVGKRTSQVWCFASLYACIFCIAFTIAFRGQFVSGSFECILEVPNYIKVDGVLIPQNAVNVSYSFLPARWFVISMNMCSSINNLKVDYLNWATITLGVLASALCTSSMPGAILLLHKINIAPAVFAISIVLVPLTV